MLKEKNAELIDRNKKLKKRVEDVKTEMVEQQKRQKYEAMFTITKNDLSYLKDGFNVPLISNSIEDTEVIAVKMSDQ